MGEAPLIRKGTSNSRFAMQYFSERGLSRLGAYNFRSMLLMKRWLPLTMLAFAPLAAPLLAASHPLIALGIRSFFSRLCHQNPARSFVIQGSPVAVCVRCLGIYCGVALGALFRSAKMPGAVSQLLWSHKDRGFGLHQLRNGYGPRLLAVALLLNLLDVTAGTLHWYGNLPLPRFLLGLILGMGAGAVLFSTGNPKSPQLLTNRPGGLPGPR